MAFIMYHTTEGNRRAYFQCSVCGENYDEELYVSPDFVSEKACHVCGPEYGYTRVMNATFKYFLLIPVI